VADVVALNEYGEATTLNRSETSGRRSTRYHRPPRIDARWSLIRQ
jgi:hypothetical protein